MGGGRRRIGVLLLLWFVALAVPCAARANSSEGLKAGEQAPQFAGKDLSGATVDLASLLRENKAVLVNFWGLRCGACLQEMPSLAALHAKYKGKGLSIVGVNVDGVGADVIKAQLPRLQVSPPYTVMTDEELKVADLYKLAAAPLTILMDRSGKIVYTHEGYRPGDEKELDTSVDALLR